MKTKNMDMEYKEKMMDKLIIKKKMEHMREDSFWYDGLIAKYGKFRLFAVGDISVGFPDGKCQTNGNAVEYADELGYIDNNLYPNDFQEEIIGLEWYSNNWFEVGWKDEDGYLEFDIGVVEHDYLSAIEMLEAYYKGEIK